VDSVQFKTKMELSPAAVPVINFWIETIPSSLFISNSYHSH
jgi:hypothetical protein